MSYKEFDFDIVWVCKQLGLPINLKNNRSFYVDCPFCGRRAKMNINIEKNAFRCPACDEHGGMLRLYQLMKGLYDTKEARRELYSIFYDNESNNLNEIATRKEQIAKLPKMRAIEDISVRNATYNALLDCCSLSKRHSNNLKKRGLTEEAIIRGQYKSVPQVGLYSISKKIISEGNVWKGIPGFSQKDGNIRITENKSGFFIPVRNIDGYISGMQIRFDEGNKRRYIWFTSNNMEDGCSVSGIEQIHYAGIRRNNVPKVIGITEGPLKADIACELLGIPFIAIIGVANLSQLEENLKLLKELGVEEVNEMFDMDYFEKENVKKFIDKAHEIIKSVGFKRVIRRKWDNSYKGIDDFALARSQGKVKEKSSLFKTTAQK